MFDPALAGYWGSRSYEAQTETVLAIIAANGAKIDGIKISLLSAEKEIELRRRRERRRLEQFNEILGMSLVVLEDPQRRRARRRTHRQPFFVVQRLD